MTTTVSIYNVLKADVTARLVEELVTNVSDDSKLVLVQEGIEKGLPTDNRLLLTVETGDEAWRHTLNISSENVGMTAPIGEIGGTLYWRSRFKACLEMYFAPTVSQANASKIAHVVLSRARWSLQNKNLDGSWWFSTTADDFGESASRIMVMDAFLAEGGSNRKWTWRGEIRFEFLGEAEGCV